MTRHTSLPQRRHRSGSPGRSRSGFTRGAGLGAAAAPRGAGLGAAAALCAVLAIGCDAGPLGWFGGSAQSGLDGAAVRRGPLRITVVERGNLKSKDTVSLKSELEGQTTILYLIPEGTVVQTGDLLCELDATKLDEQRVQQEISLSNADATYVKAVAQLEIQQSQNASDVDAAQRQLDFAEIDLAKFEDGEAPQQLAKADEDIALAEESLKQAVQKCEWSAKLAEKGFLTSTELDADRLAEKSSKFKLDQAQRALVLLKEYDHPRKRRELQANVEEAKHKLERTQLQAKARLVDAEAAVRTSKEKLELEKERLTKVNSQIDKAKLRAPVAGTVVYAQQEGNRMGQSDPIAEGTLVRERQEIINIPASGGGVIAEASVHESVLEQIQTGQTCELTVEALPGRLFRGEVTFKAQYADKNSWWANPNLRVYRTVVEVHDPDVAMRAGMTCAIEFLSAVIPDALYVPVQSVFVHQGEPVCFVVAGGQPEIRPVKVGRHSSKWAEILSGASEGEIVLLAQPAGFALEAALDPEPEPEAVPPPAPGASGAPGSFGEPNAGAADRGGERGAGSGEGRGRRPGRGQQGDRPGGGRPAEGEPKAGAAGEGATEPGAGGRP